MSDNEFIDYDNDELVWVVSDNGYEVTRRSDERDSTIYFEDGEPIDLRLLEEDEDDDLQPE